MKKHNQDNIIKDFNLIDISNDEHKLVTIAKQKFGKCYETAEMAVNLLKEPFKSSEAVAWLFMSFFSQIQNFALLALLSVVRQHYVQAFMCLRQMLESGVLAAYALNDNNKDTFFFIDESGLFETKDDVRGKAYNWLEKYSPNHNKIIKEEKERVNKYWAHSSPLHPHLNFDYEFIKNKNFSWLFFDQDNKFLSESVFYLITKCSLTLLDLFSKLIKETNMAKMIDDYDSRYFQLYKDMESMRRESIKSINRKFYWSGEE